MSVSALTRALTLVCLFFNKRSYRLNRGQAIGASLQKIWNSHRIPILTKIRLMKALVWPVATYDYESWTPRNNEEARLNARGRRGRPRMAWMDNIKTWTGLHVEESFRMTEYRDKWRKYVDGVVNPRIEDGKRTEQNRSNK